MPLPALAAIGLKAAPALFSAGYKWLSGNKQVKEGRQIEKNNKFTSYKRPGEVVDALNIAERNYTNGMPGSELLENRINTAAGAALTTAREGASSSADVLDAATKINANTNTALQNLGQKELEYKLASGGQYLGQLNNNATYADKEFNYNVAQPYAKNAAAASALIGSGQQNKFSGVDEAMGTITDVIGSLEKKSTMGDQLGLGPIADAASVGVTNSMGKLSTPLPLTMGTKYGNPTLPPAQSVGVSLTNPAMVGQIIADMKNGTKRWANR